MTVADEDVAVVIGIDTTLRLTTNGTEIGEWSPGEFFITDHGDGAYTITAENEALRFTPSEPDLFAHWVRTDNLSVGKHEARGAVPAQPPVEFDDDNPELPPVTGADTVEAPGELAPLTRTLFYLLVAATSVLGIWAAYSLIT